ncbi:MAG: UDP-3-O-(3-hydroxymyristoyl)glucosamine N-acyltransferase [Candidatus Solibacter sp.]|nr:UDP-3-O-(3-hydroxymyristoyl)glucosamine N-acyltransferase [Candidatus Solibacter sp.]
MTVREAAERLGLAYEGEGLRAIKGCATLAAAGAFDAAFVNSTKARKEAAEPGAGCLIVPLDYDNAAGRTVMRAKDPRREMARLVRLLHPQAAHVPGIHRTAVIDETAEVAATAAIGPHVTVGAGAKIGADVAIGAGTRIGARVKIGAESLIHANVTIYDEVEVGERAVVHSGAVIGADGFGFAFHGGRWEKFPQVGKVVIGDDFEMGANSTVDRAALGVTRIGDGVKFDNMVHIGHNCTVGNHVVIAAQTGIAGGCTIEDYAVIGGQVGMGEAVTVKAGAVIGSGAGILNSKVVKGGGEVHWGTPARPLKQYLETLASVSRVPGMRRRIAELEETVRRLEAKL